MNRYGVVLGVAGLSLVAGSIGAWRFAGTSESTQSRPSDAELEALKLEIGAMKRALRRSDAQRQLAAVANAPEPRALPDAESATAAAPDDREPPFAAPEDFKRTLEARREEALSRQRERREQFDATLHGEPRDARWASEATKTVEGWLTETGLSGFTLTELDCRSSLCRARFSVPEGKASEDFMLATMGKMATFQTSSLHLVDQGGGRRELVAYLGRAGEPLPP